MPSGDSTHQVPLFILLTHIMRFVGSDPRTGHNSVMKYIDFSLGVGPGSNPGMGHNSVMKVSGNRTRLHVKGKILASPYLTTCFIQK